MLKIQTLNNISVKGLERLPRDRYEIASEFTHPDAILVRSFNMHDFQVPDSVKAIGRAGAGVNNIPVDRMSQRGVVVFNAPGANANAVKELVLAAMFLAARNICQAWEFARALEGDDGAVNSQVEAGKKAYVGYELPGRTLGVIGLGAVGVKVANSAMALGMRVVGYDPLITVQRAWQLSSHVGQAHNVDDLVSMSDFVTLHVPLNDHTRHMIDGERLSMMPRGAVVLNFSRAGIVDDKAVVEAIESGHIGAYICDFPSNRLKNHPRIVALPHLGASTAEAEENCAVMVADQVREYLETGNVTHSVNFPEMIMPRNGNGDRLSVVNANVPNMLGQISTMVAEAGLNIEDMYNKAKGDLAYTLVDVNGKAPETLAERIAGIEGVMAVRVIE